MPPKKDLSIRLSAELREALDRAAAQGETITAIVERALAAHLGIMQGPTLADRVRVLELTVADLQRNATQRPTPLPDNAAQGRAKPPSPSPSPVGTEQVEPDGVRWLTAGQGYQVAVSQGYENSLSRFRVVAREDPAGVEQRYGLRRLNRPRGDSKSASYEVVKQRP